MSTKELNWTFIKRCLKFRRQKKRLLSQGYRQVDLYMHTDYNEEVIDVKIATTKNLLYIKCRKEET